jgi:hypothetical protein
MLFTQFCNQLVTLDSSGKHTRRAPTVDSSKSERPQRIPKPGFKNNLQAAKESEARSRGSFAADLLLKACLVRVVALDNFVGVNSFSLERLDP